MLNQINLIINPNSSRDNYIAGGFIREKEKISKRINRDPLLITQLEINMGVRILRKDAKYYEDLLQLNKNKKAIVHITFE